MPHVRGRNLIGRLPTPYRPPGGVTLGLVPRQPPAQTSAYFASERTDV
jgi:hypothetical protein